MSRIMRYFMDPPSLITDVRDHQISPSEADSLYEEFMRFSQPEEWTYSTGDVPFETTKSICILATIIVDETHPEGKYRKRYLKFLGGNANYEFYEHAQTVLALVDNVLIPLKQWFPRQKQVIAFLEQILLELQQRMVNTCFYHDPDFNINILLDYIGSNTPREVLAAVYHHLNRSKQDFLRMFEKPYTPNQQERLNKIQLAKALCQSYQYMQKGGTTYNEMKTLTNPNIHDYIQWYLKKIAPTLTRLTQEKQNPLANSSKFQRIFNDSIKNLWEMFFVLMEHPYILSSELQIILKDKNSKRESITILDSYPRLIACLPLFLNGLKLRKISPTNNETLAANISWSKKVFNSHGLDTFVEDKPVEINHAYTTKTIRKKMFFPTEAHFVPLFPEELINLIQSFLLPWEYPGISPGVKIPQFESKQTASPIFEIFRSADQKVYSEPTLTEDSIIALTADQETSLIGLDLSSHQTKLLQIFQFREFGLLAWLLCATFGKFIPANIEMAKRSGKYELQYPITEDKRIFFNYPHIQKTKSSMTLLQVILSEMAILIHDINTGRSSDLIIAVSELEALENLVEILTKLHPMEIHAEYYKLAAIIGKDWIFQCLSEGEYNVTGSQDILNQVLQNRQTPILKIALEATRLHNHWLAVKFLLKKGCCTDFMISFDDEKTRMTLLSWLINFPAKGNQELNKILETISILATTAPHLFKQAEIGSAIHNNRPARMIHLLIKLYKSCHPQKIIADDLKIWLALNEETQSSQNTQSFIPKYAGIADFANTTKSVEQQLSL